MKQSTQDLAENKVLILYLINKLPDGIKSDNLFKIVSSTNGINYFYFQELLSDLIATNLVGSFTKDEDTFIKITNKITNFLICIFIFNLFAFAQSIYINQFISINYI